jgi:phosphomannomutase
MDLDKGTQRKIETAFFREDFRRAHIDDIGTTVYATDVRERYTQAFLAVIDRESIGRAGYRLVVDYSRGTASEFLPDIFRGLGVEVINLNAEHGLIRTVRSAPEYATAYDHLSHIVPALGFDLGVMLDVNGERLQVVDRHGRQVPQPQVLAAMACLVFQARKGAGVAVPVDAPAIFEALASRYGGRIVCTRLDFQAIMAAAGQNGVVMGGAAPSVPWSTRPSMPCSAWSSSSSFSPTRTPRWTSSWPISRPGTCRRQQSIVRGIGVAGSCGCWGSSTATGESAHRMGSRSSSVMSGC